MLIYRRVLAVIALTTHDEFIVRRALQVACLCGAKLGVVHVMDYTPGLEADQFPILTREQVQASLVEAAHKKISSLLERINVQDAEQHVVTGTPQYATADFIADWGADLVVVGSNAPHGLRKEYDGDARKSACDMLTVQLEPSGAMRRLQQALSPLFAGWPRRPASSGV